MFEFYFVLVFFGLSLCQTPLLISYGVSLLYSSSSAGKATCSGPPSFLYFYPMIGNSKSTPNIPCSQFSSLNGDASYYKSTLKSVSLTLPSLAPNSVYVFIRLYEDPACTSKQSSIVIGVQVGVCSPVDKYLPPIFGPFVFASCSGVSCTISSYNDPACSSPVSFPITNGNESPLIDNVCRMLMGNSGSSRPLYGNAVVANTDSNGNLVANLPDVADLSLNIYLNIVEEYNNNDCNNVLPYRVVKTPIIGPGCNDPSLQNPTCTTSNIVQNLARRTYCKPLSSSQSPVDQLSDPNDSQYTKKLSFRSNDCDPNNLSKAEYLFYLKDQSQFLTCLNLSPFLSVDVAVYNSSKVINTYYQGTCESQVFEAFPGIYDIETCFSDTQTTGSVLYRI